MNSFFKKLKGEEVSTEKEQGARKMEKPKPEKPKEWFKPDGKLPVDVYQTDTDIVIQSPIAGIKKGDLDISIEHDMVTIKGVREKSDTVEEKNYFTQECYWGAFSREIVLPMEADPSRAEATMKDGILTLKIPIIEREKKRKIEIE